MSKLTGREKNVIVNQLLKFIDKTKGGTFNTISLCRDDFKNHYTEMVLIVRGDNKRSFSTETTIDKLWYKKTKSGVVLEFAEEVFRVAPQPPKRRVRVPIEWDLPYYWKNLEWKIEKQPDGIIRLIILELDPDTGVNHVKDIKEGRREAIENCIWDDFGIFPKFPE